MYYLLTFLFQHWINRLIFYLQNYTLAEYILKHKSKFLINTIM